jgi:hypothetical protein
LDGCHIFQLLLHADRSYHLIVATAFIRLSVVAAAGAPPPPPHIPITPGINLASGT